MSNISHMLSVIADNIDVGNSNISEDEALEICKYISSLTNTEHKMSKYQAIRYLEISRSTFDSYVSKGLIPKGRKQQGFKEKFWYLKDLKQFKENK